MTEKFFVDTNILVYARDKADKRKQQIASNLVKKLWEKGTGCISFQVLNEYFVVLTSKFHLEDEVVLAEIDDFLSWNPCELSGDIYDRAKRLRKHYRLSWWDCQIVATAEQTGCAVLYSEDFSHSAIYGNIKVVNPFAS